MQVHPVVAVRRSPECLLGRRAQPLWKGGDKDQPESVETTPVSFRDTALQRHTDLIDTPGCTVRVDQVDQQTSADLDLRRLPAVCCLRDDAVEYLIRAGTAQRIPDEALDRRTLGHR